ncbi:hypothetical protein [Noviherbaspirillum sp.]|uniref:hypothetical protein n=1 Tax=Noviherbaspirillum sp. TaxID=1926288 RepID=UPI002FE0F6EA
MVKFHFSILTRSGQKIDSLAIMGRDRDEAERKLRQMYRDCEVLRCGLQPAVEKRIRAAPADAVLSLVSK